MSKNTLIFQLLLLTVLACAAFAEKGAVSVEGLDRPAVSQTPGDSSEETPAFRRPMPVYLSELSNLNDYSLFASGGWDGNWYVGFNACWIEEIPQIPENEYRKFYIGAKIGRMKTRKAAGKPSWEKEAIPGMIYMAISSTPAWKTAQQYFLAASEDIPLEPDAENALEGVGESRWFWAEVPKEAVNMNGPNYVALWSPTDYFISVASAPILAGGWGSKKANSWISNDVRGYPPLKADYALKTAITVFEPAIAMKCVPAGTEQEIGVTVVSIKPGRERTSNQTFTLDVSGDGIEKAWLEISADGKKWLKNSRAIYTAPYTLTLIGDKMPEGKIKVRAAATDIWGNTGYSQTVEILVSKVQNK